MLFPRLVCLTVKKKLKRVKKRQSLGAAKVERERESDYNKFINVSRPTERVIFM